MRLVKTLILESKIFSRAILDQVTASGPLSRKIPRNIWIFKHPYYNAVMNMEINYLFQFDLQI